MRSRSSWVVLLLLLLASGAEGAVVWLVAEPGDRYHQQLIGALQERRWPANSSLSLRALDETKIVDKSDLVVTMGKNAAARWSDAPNPVLHLFVTHSQFKTLYPRGLPAGHSALFLEQSHERYLALVRAALPSVSNLILPYSSLDKSEIDALHRAAERYGLAVQPQEVGTPQELDRVLVQSEVLRDAVLLLPDPGLSSSTMMKVAILGAYKRRLPLVAYSEGLATAGALIAVHTTVPLLAEEAAELIQQFATTGKMRAPSYLSRFDLSVNYQLASSLNLSIPSKERLMQRMKERLGEVPDVR